MILFGQNEETDFNQIKERHVDHDHLDSLMCINGPDNETAMVLPESANCEPKISKVFLLFIRLKELQLFIILLHFAHL